MKPSVVSAFASLSSTVFLCLSCSMTMTSAANSLRANGAGTSSDHFSSLQRKPTMTNYIRPRDRNLGKLDDDNVDPRIINGEDADPDDWRFFVRYGGCGGSLISENYVLTAGHCGAQGASFVRVGAYKQHWAEDEHDTEVDIADWIYHPFYQNLEQDFLLLRLEEPVPGGPYVALNSDHTVPSESEDLEVIGLGRLNYATGVNPDTLQEVYVPSHTMEYCQGAYGGFNETTMFCAGNTTYDSCVGDSGGPILTKSGIQVGLTSFGDDCAKAGKPGVYARVSFAYDWIRSVACAEDNEGLCAEGGVTQSTPTPTSGPTSSPTESPTSSPTFSPTDSPTSSPTASPTSAPTVAPTDEPSMAPVGPNDGSAPDNQTPSPVSPTPPPVTINVTVNTPSPGGTTPPPTPGNQLSAFECADSREENPIRSAAEITSCDFLASNMNTMGHMCDFVDVTLACMETCGLCTLLAMFYEANTESTATERNGVRV